MQNGYFRYWGKAEKDGSKYHPAICHMLDVGLVAQVLLEKSSPAFKRYFLKALDCHENEKIAWIAFIVSLHDVGKISPGFQAKRSDLIIDLPKQDFPFSEDFDETDHGRITFRVLPDILKQFTSCSHDVATSLSRAVAGHHGEFHQAVSPQNQKSTGRGGWPEARVAMVEALRDAFGLHWETFPFRNIENISANFLMTLAGLTSIADWIGSNEEPDMFSYVGEFSDTPAAYYKIRQSIAIHAVETINLDRLPAQPGISNFADLFPFITLPNLCQQAVLESFQKITPPSLIIVETPMGSGKTEAALAVCDKLLREHGASGLYYALPTQATGNKMFNRVEEFLKKNPAYRGAELHLLHSYSDLHEGYAALKVAAVYGNKGDSTVAASEWFCSRKRGLISPFAVGTIDQALLAVLQSRHMFVRLFGLTGKVVIIDEVHAYDTYTSTLFDRLLEWLSAMETSVILLSATLPAKRRLELLRAYAPVLEFEPVIRYPSVISLNKNGECEAKHIPGFPQQSFHLKFITETGAGRLKRIEELLWSLLRNGGCAACIMNTVGEAQQLFQHLKAELDFKDDTRFILFHARFPMGQRLEIEKEVDRLFGKGADTARNVNRPHRAIVVSTQVLEQSLDVDFDVMVTDIAPVDLILQRSGRLHRHNKNNELRPDNLKQAILFCCQKKMKSENPDFGASGKVYEPVCLLKSALVLEQYVDKEIVLPDTVETLISQVYGPDTVECPEHLQDTLTDWKFESGMINREIVFMGKSVVIPSPELDGDDSDILGQLAYSFDDDNLLPKSKAQTRLARPSIIIIILHEQEGGISLEKDSLIPVKLNQPPDKDMVRQLIEKSVQISNPGWYSYFNTQEAPKGWEKVPLLRNCRAAVFTEGVLKNASNILRIDNDLGIIIFAKSGKGVA